VGRDARGLNVVAGCSKVVFSEVYLGLDDGKLVAEVSEPVVLAAVALQFGGGVPVVEVGDGAAECVEGRGWTNEEGVEQTRKGFGDVHR
jgi:hypothetical protein